MSRVLPLAIGALTIVVIGVLGVSIYGQYHLIVSDEIEMAQRFLLLPGIAISAGVLIAVLTFVREKGKAEVEAQRHRSEVFLQQATEGFKTVIDLLADQNNSRITWLRAARTLLQVRKMGRQISSEEYKVAYKLREEQARNELYMVLTLFDAETGGRQPLPPQFFYGIDNWRECAKLDEAAVGASNSSSAYSITIDSVPPRPTLRPIAPKSVVAVYEFIEYPKDYEDPLEAVQDWGEDWDRSFDIDQGARRYVAHTKQKIAINGELHDRRSGKDGRSAAEAKSS